jgi:hypothetical protein
MADRLMFQNVILHVFGQALKHARFLQEEANSSFAIWSGY